ncbi:arylsulfatase atsA [Mycobacterium tuberculosis]|nr:arylsulfatase atsA [Mycobacterium tuberculosis]
MSSHYEAPFAFTGGTITQVTVDVSGRPFEDVESDLALAFSRD